MGAHSWLDEWATITRFGGLRMKKYSSAKEAVGGLTARLLVEQNCLLADTTGVSF
jgi:hypothetical protein